MGSQQSTMKQLLSSMPRSVWKKAFFLQYVFPQTLLDVKDLNDHVLYFVPKSSLPMAIVIVIKIIITKILFNRMLVLPTTRQPSTILAWLPTITSVKTGWICFLKKVYIFEYIFTYIWYMVDIYLNISLHIFDMFDVVTHYFFNEKRF